MLLVRTGLTAALMTALSSPISPKQSIIPLLVFSIGVMNVLIAADAAKRRFKMKTFTIENETNNITIHTTVQDAEAVAHAERFPNEGGLAKLAANWPAARLVDIWNSLPGEPPVKKFKDRATAVNRIWRAIQ